MKILSKINSISSLNDKNLERFSLGNNNNRFLVTKSYIDSFDFLPGGSSSYTTTTLDTQPLSSAKSLKFNNNSDNSSASAAAAAVFWDFTKPSLSSLPNSSNTTNLRNTVSSSNLTLNINYGDNQTNQIPLVLPQKFQFNQPQAQPIVMKQQQQQQQQTHHHQPPSSSSLATAVSAMSQSHHQLQLQQADEQLQQYLCSRKNSLPHSSNLINNNHTTTSTSTILSSSSNELNLNGVNGATKNNGKLMTTSGMSSNNMSSSTLNIATSELQHHHQQLQQQQQQMQQQNGNQNDQQQPNKSASLKCPVVASPHQVMMLYMNKLTPYEHHEIYKYSQIYFIGANAKKRNGPNEYDNENGSYIHIPHDHIAYRYEVLKIIGKGSFGQVVKAYDHKTREHVALKMVRNEKRFHRQAQEEIRILKHLRAQDKDNSFNIIHM
jgi:Protein kinase domain